ncbi:MAG: 4Fe-4S binding protein [Thermoactinomyces sp.]
MLSSKLKEIVLCLKAGRVTLAYPFVSENEGHLGSPTFRGRPTIDGEKCLGCGACAQVCPPRLISLIDRNNERMLELDYSRCTYCGRCQDVCPTGAASLTREFELATDTREDMKIRILLSLEKCEACGTPFTTGRMIEKLENEFVPEWMKEKTELPKWLRLCADCRQRKTGVNFDLQGGMHRG